MFCRSWTCAFSLAAALMVATDSVRAADEAKFPNWKGQWLAAKTQDEADVLLGPFLVSQQHCDKRTELGLHFGEKEINSVEAP